MHTKTDFRLKSLSALQMTAALAGKLPITLKNSILNYMRSARRMKSIPVRRKLLEPRYSSK